MTPLYHGIISGEAGPIWIPVRAALHAASWGYRGAIALRNRRFERDRSRIHRLPVPVISVGNITTGGTGKTPLVIDIIQRLQRAGHRPAVVSRGYRAGSAETADELLVVRRRCGAVITVADPDRVAGARRAVEDGANVIVLDDAFQHRRIHRDLDIVVIDATRPFGYGYLLPRGLLREPPSSLARAHLIVLSRTDAVKDEQLASIQSAVRRHNTAAPILRCRHRPTHVVGLEGEVLDLAALGGKRMIPFAGVGNFAAFRHTLQGLGALLQRGCSFTDHSQFEREAYQRLSDFVRAGDAVDSLVTTEKDWVKLAPALWRSFPLPIYAVAINIEFFEDGAVILHRLLGRLMRPERSGSADVHRQVPTH